tara:strand:- start:199 stop:2688 length:2490 start_codon:yes stop_codon:yes gene_type:complete
MATKNIVPRADSEGKLGTPSKFWLSAYLDGLNLGNAAASNLVFTPSTGDTVTFAAGTNGTLTITTVDTAAAAANVGFVVDGTFDIDAAGAVTIDGSAITIGGDSDVAIDIDSSTLDIDASGAITLDGVGLAVGSSGAASLITSGAASDIVVTTVHTAGMAFQLNANTNAASEVEINAGILDLNASGNITIDGADDITTTAVDNLSLATSSADGLLLISSAHTAGQAIHIDGNANAGSIVDVDAGILDIDVTAAATIDAVGVAIGAGSGELDLTTTGTMDVNSAALDIDTSGAITIDAAGVASDISISTAHTAGTAFLLDANANAGSIVQVDAGILDLNVTGVSTLNTTGLTITGPTLQLGNFTTGADDTGVDVRFFSATASEGILYDASEDELGLLLTTKLKFHDIGGGEEIFASANGHLEINAGTTLDITAPTIDVNGTMDVSGAFTNGSTLVSTGKITADAGIDIDNINIDGTTIALSSGHLTLDLAAQLIIDSDDDGSITLKNSGTSYGLISSDNTAGDFKFKSVIQDKDIVFQGNDGGTGFTALTIDMSAGGNITMPRAYNDTSSTVLYVDSTITGGASTYQGSLLLQAGGDGSASYGAGFRLYGHVHASKPGSAEVGLSATDGAKFTINNYGAGGGNELFKVERDNGNATVSLGNLVIGTAGKGIDFSAQTPTSVGGADNVAEVLDHYEEGTWTPAIEGQGAAGNWTYAYRTGEYTRIGNQVHISSHIRATVASGANATGSCHINNLPFTSENTNNHNTGVQPAAGYASHVYLTVSPNTNNILVGRMDQSGITTALAEAQFNASNGLSRSEFQMAFDFTYTVPT